MKPTYRDQISDLLDELPEENVRALLELLRRPGPRKRPRRWSSAVGSVSHTDAQQMRRAVEEGCESIDPNSW